MMKIALIQLDTAWEDNVANIEIAEKYLGRAVAEGCDIAVLPEMFNTGFSMNTADTAEPEGGPTAMALARMAKQHGINIVAGITVQGEKDKDYNMALVYDTGGGLIAGYRKIHPFTFAGEDRHFEAGGETVVFNIAGMPASVLICYDLRFPEVFRAVAKQVQAVFVIANWPAARAGHWDALLKARAIENQCFIIGVNRRGADENGLSYAGGSVIYGPMGQRLCIAGEGDEMAVCEVDPAEVAQVRAEYPFLSDMRF